MDDEQQKNLKETVITKRIEILRSINPKNTHPVAYNLDDLVSLDLNHDGKHIYNISYKSVDVTSKTPFHMIIHPLTNNTEPEDNMLYFVRSTWDDTNEQHSINIPVPINDMVEIRKSQLNHIKGSTDALLNGLSSDKTNTVSALNHHMSEYLSHMYERLDALSNDNQSNKNAMHEFAFMYKTGYNMYTLISRGECYVKIEYTILHDA